MNTTFIRPTLARNRTNLINAAQDIEGKKRTVDNNNFIGTSGQADKAYAIFEAYVLLKK